VADTRLILAATPPGDTVPEQGRDRRESAEGPPGASSSVATRTLGGVYRFVLRPRWIVSHLFVLALVLTMVNLGFWQLRRLDEKRQHNDRVRGRITQPVAALDDLPGASEAGAVEAAASTEFRRVRVSGSFVGSEQVLVRSRSLDDSPGSWVLAPLRTENGTLVIVNRGWIANDGTFDAVPRPFSAPSGRVTVSGIVMRTQTRGRFGPIDPPGGRLTSLARVDIGRYARQLEGPVLPVWVQQRSITPAPAASTTVPRVLDPPELDEGPHFGYAMQWFIFSTIAVVGYPLILRRNARERAADGGHTSSGGGASRTGPADLATDGVESEEPASKPVPADR